MTSGCGLSLAMSVAGTSILANLYSAVLDSTKWQVFCDSFTDMTGGAVMLFGHRIDLNQSLGLIGGGIDPAELARYHLC